MQKNDFFKTTFLPAYAQLGYKPLLVSRLRDDAWWGDRTFYESEGYDPKKHYNHRSILPIEVVIEFDHKDTKTNLELANKVTERLTLDKVRFALWYSGGKSYHVHFLINTRNVRNIRLLKKVVLRYYSRDLPFKPDSRLCVDGHLVRAEGGFHEGKRRYKKLITLCDGYFEPSTLPQAVWEDYVKAMTTVVRRETSRETKDLECSCIKYLSNVTVFRQNEDGRERALFILIHSLKNKYSKDDLVDFLIDWYRYSGGYKLSHEAIRRKVYYHYNRSYGTFTMIKDLLEDLGQEAVLANCSLHGNKKNEGESINNSDDYEVRGD